VKNKSSKQLSVPRPGKGASLPIRWSDLPHQELWEQARNAIPIGARERAAEDSVRHILKRQLPRLDRADHTRYVELEAVRIVELLRAVRDEYREYLEKLGCKPLAEMYWVVFRFGVMHHAINILRAAAFDYVKLSKIEFEDWQFLFGPSTSTIRLKAEASKSELTLVERTTSIKKMIDWYLRDTVFNEFSTGGPFARSAQFTITRGMPLPFLITEQFTFIDLVHLRQKVWDRCAAWTEGLSKMFDAVQGEILYQRELLPEDFRRAEAIYVKLSLFQRIVHKHFVNFRTGGNGSRNLGAEGWMPLLRELDQEQIPLDTALTGNARKALMAVRRKGRLIDSWVQCYESNTSIFLEDAKSHTLKREVTHAIHNAAKRADNQLRKVWVTKKSPK
jgi:hypothetical protein